MISIALILIVGGLLLTPIWLKLDTRVPVLQIDWKPIGSLRIYFKDDWMLGGRILFFPFRGPIAEMIHPSKKKVTKHPAKRRRPIRLNKILRMLKSFRVESWECGFDSGDFTRNAQLYALNFHPHTRDHLFVNFKQENYLYLKIQNSLLNMILYLIR